MELSPITVGVIGFVILFVLMFLKMPVAFAFALTGFVGLWYVRGFNAALNDLPVSTWSTISDYVLICLPLFILMGAFANYSGIGPDLYMTALKWFGKLPGGLAITTVMGNAAFGAVTGASLAGLVTFTPIAWKPMMNLGYDKRLAAGCLMCSGTLSQLIPPSLSFILYSAATNESIGRLFIAGIFPGILQAIMYVGLILVLTSTKMMAGPPGPASTWRERFVSLKDTWGMLFVFILVIGGIYSGLFTPTEGSAVGAGGTFLIFLARKGFNGKLIAKSLEETLRTSAMLFAIIFSSLIFARFLSSSGVTAAVAQWVIGMSLNPYMVLLWALIVLLIAGCVMPATPMVLLFVPLFYPIFVTQYGMDGIWLGVIVVVMVELALVTPPVGLHLFVFQALVKDEIKTKELWQGVMPFVLVDILRLAIMVAIPAISIWLPQRMYG